ncbi:MAG: response regulator transcription factor [Pseudomonadota bacterium]|jgi:DNA-binding response OmpR family regulator
MTASARIAIVEDDAILRDDLVDFLGRRGFTVQGFEHAAALYRSLACSRFDLALLDILLPGGESGLDIARWLRANQPGVGVVMLTSLGATQDQVKGLEAGADVYLAKNTSLEVIEATCRSVLRRLASTTAQPAAATSVEASGWRLNTATLTLEPPQGQAIELTHAEAMFLWPLLSAPGKPVSRDGLLVQMSKPSTLSNLRNLDSLAQRLRKKVLASCAIELPVKPSYGAGYLFAGNGLRTEPPSQTRSTA